MNLKIYEEITKKKEFSKLPKEDVELAFSHFEKRQVSDEEKIRLTRELLHKVFSSFTGQKLLSPKNKGEEWILRKHLSTRERLPYYGEIYERIFRKNKKEVMTVIDLGAGVNGFSYKFMGNVNYIGIEVIGQLVDLMNDYFKREELFLPRYHHPLFANPLSQPTPYHREVAHHPSLTARAYHLSLFDLKKIKELINKTKKPRVVFLFKTLDSLEMLEKDYSKKLLKEITPLVSKVVVSFATKSMVKKERFKVSRNWIFSFIKEKFKVLDDFEIGGERYNVFK